MVDEQFSDAVCVDFLETKENRYIDGIHIDEFRKENDPKFKKFPKGWTYNTKLYEIETITNHEDEKLFNELCVRIDNPESLKKAYELGLFVKSNTKFHGTIETDITKEGYRVITKYPMQIDKTLGFWQRKTDATDEEMNAYRKWILDMKNVEDIETRIFDGNIQWKYEKNKKWNNITL